MYKNAVIVMAIKKDNFKLVLSGKKYINEIIEEPNKIEYPIPLCKNEEFADLKIIRYDNNITFEWCIKILDNEEGSIDGMLEIDKDYEIADYNIKSFDYSGNMKKII